MCIWICYGINQYMQKEGTLRNILDQKELRWVFVGGKGGVGKTTTSSSLAVLLANQNRKTLIISTDPAHNLSDCFDQKFNHQPTPVKGIDNLFAMEIDPKKNLSSLAEYDIFSGEEGGKGMLTELLGSVPGIDEAMSFSQLINSIEKMLFDIIVFDTAPTGHTLRFLNFPNTLEKGLEKLMGLKDKFGKLFEGVGTVLGSKESFDQMIGKFFGKMENLKNISHKVNEQMKDPMKTTFVTVCIPQFLSLYETQRLIQELATYEIDIHNVVVNQILFPEDTCKMCVARSKMQKKYLDQMIQLYGDDFHVIIMPLQEEEVRGINKISYFSQLLLKHKQLPK